MRIALGVEYDGTEFCGWQIQKSGRSVQHALEEALTRLADRPVATVCAGRTDARVHAAGQVVHLDTDALRPPHAWVLGTNRFLPRDAGVLWARAVDESFHARFGAVERCYRYVICNRPTRPSLHRHRACWIHRMLDVAVMNDAARAFVGTHDFSSLRASACQAKSPVREVRRLEVSRSGEWVVIDIAANAFLHHMVRNVAGVLTKIGRGDAPPEWAGAVLEARDRRAAGVTAPPQGLYLVGVRYPDRFGLPAPDARTAAAAVIRI